MKPDRTSAAQTVIDTVVQMASEGRPLMQRVLPVGELLCWDHYPDDDARDSVTRSRWYYHAHEPGDRDADEHGHFHLFLPRALFRKPLEPMARPAGEERGRANMVHVAGLAIDHQGVPLRWFATNRWVTDEWLYPAAAVVARLHRYNVDNTAEDPVVNRFLTAMVQLHADDIADMLAERDARLQQLGATAGQPGLYESGNDVLATRPIDLDVKIAEIMGA